MLDSTDMVDYHFVSTENGSSLLEIYAPNGMSFSPNGQFLALTTINYNDELAGAPNTIWIYEVKATEPWPMVWEYDAVNFSPDAPHWVSNTELSIVKLMPTIDPAL